MQHQTRIRKGFDRLASVYDFFSRLFFGRALFNSQKYFIPKLDHYSSVLVFGGGTGKILTELLEHNPKAKYVYVDVSEKMSERAKRRVGKMNPNISFLCGSYDVIPSTEKFDLIITPYVLDCFDSDELPKVMDALDEKLSPQGKWLMTDFHIPPKGGMKIFSKLIVGGLYIFFNFACGLGVKSLPDFGKQFLRLSYRIQEQKYFLKGMLTATIYSRR